MKPDSFLKLLEAVTEKKDITFVTVDAGKVWLTSTAILEGR